MKVKKIFPLLLVFTLLLTTVGCTPKTKYDNKQVIKIETQMYNGEGIVGYRMRLFDFASGIVTDKAVVSDIELDYLLQLYADSPSEYPEYESVEQCREYLLANYNVSVPVAEFSQKNGSDFVNTVKALGMYTWKESYVDNYICDATTKCIIITFADGTTKNTRFYHKYPQNFAKAEAAFEAYFGTQAWCELRLK